LYPTTIRSNTPRERTRGNSIVKHIQPVFEDKFSDKKFGKQTKETFIMAC
jgi:hypothetical protein